MRRFFASVLILGVCLVGTGVARAEFIGPVDPPTIILDIVGDGSPGQAVAFDILDDFEAEGSKYKFKGIQGQVMFGEGAGSQFTIEEIEFDPDPYVLHNYIITNNTASTQTYNVTNTLPTVFNVSPNQIAGSITVQVIDGGDDSATIAAPTDGSIYRSQIDGTTVRTLLDDPYSLTTPPGATSATSGEIPFGWESNTTPVLDSIGIQLTFTLTPGDSASILSRFDVVPEPASLALLGAGGLVLLRRRRP